MIDPLSLNDFPEMLAGSSVEVRVVIREATAEEVEEAKE